MDGKGESVEVTDSTGAELGTVWESGHFAGMGKTGRVRKTPNGWTVSVSGDDIDTIDRDGVSGALYIDGADVVNDGELVARVPDESYSAAALGLVLLIESSDAPEPGAPSAVKATPIPDIPDAARPQVATAQGGPPMGLIIGIAIPMVLVIVALLAYLAMG